MVGPFEIVRTTWMWASGGARIVALGAICSERTDRAGPYMRQMQMIEVSMQLAHVRRSDLNLLPALVVLLEERSISRAAARHH
jgi:hypothetical protein